MSLDLLIHQDKMYAPSMYHAAQDTQTVTQALHYKHCEMERQKLTALGKGYLAELLYGHVTPPPTSGSIWLPLVRFHRFQPADGNRICDLIMQ